MVPLPKFRNSELFKQIDNYLDYLQSKNASPLTLRNYNHYLKRFTKFLGKTEKSPEIRSISASLIQDYRKFLAKMKLSSRTQGYHLIALRSFLKWLRKNGVRALEPERIFVPKPEPTKIKFLNGEQIDRLLNAPSLSTIQGKRNKAILELLFSTGLRVSELVKLDRDKIDFSRREFGIVGKGGRGRVVFLSARAAEWVKKYLNSRSDNYTPLFIRHKGKMDPSTPDEKMRLTPRSVQRMIKKYARKIKLPVDATPHVLRHSFATDLLIAGADLRSVQEMLGHKNITTTQIYTHVTHKHLKDVYSSFHGKSK